jgi:hypothetical protein
MAPTLRLRTPEVARPGRNGDFPQLCSRNCQRVW